MNDEAAGTSELPPDRRLDRLEREMVREDALEMAAFRRLLHGLSGVDVEGDPIAKVDAIVDRLDHLEREIQRLQAQLRAQRNQRKGTKKLRANRLARNEVLRQIAHKTNPIGEGGTVDVPTVITMGHAIGVEFTHKTVGDAFQALTAEWDCFEVQKGSGTKEGANKRLVAVDDDVSDALWQIYEAEISAEATAENDFVESSESTYGGH
jgi:hypothetical protein